MYTPLAAPGMAAVAAAAAAAAAAGAAPPTSWYGLWHTPWAPSMGYGGASNSSTVAFPAQQSASTSTIGGNNLSGPGILQAMLTQGEAAAGHGPHASTVAGAVQRVVQELKLILR